MQKADVFIGNNYQFANFVNGVWLNFSPGSQKLIQRATSHGDMHSPPHRILMFAHVRLEGVSCGSFSCMNSLVAFLYLISLHDGGQLIFVFLWFNLFTLQLIPMPVLYGVFLYMGITSLGDVQVSSSSVIVSTAITININIIIIILIIQSEIC